MNPIEIDVWQGEISELEVDAIVVPANETLFMTAGAAASVKRHAGEEVERAAVAQGPVATGEAVLTPGGQLAAPYVIHAVAVGHDRRPDTDRLRSALRAALALAERLDLRRLAIAPIGTEWGVFSPTEAAGILLAELRQRDGAVAPEGVVIATSSPVDTSAFRAALEASRSAAR